MKRPLPHATAETRPFWEGCAIGELRYQRCADCCTVQQIPRTICAVCHGGRLQWQTSARRGRILSVTTVHRAPLAAFKADVPYGLALIDLDEGFRLMVNLPRADADRVPIGEAVRIGFREIDGVHLPTAEIDR